MRTLHFGLRVADRDRSLAFYTAVGYEVVGEVPETAHGRLTMLRLPGDPFVAIELVSDGPHRAGGSGLNHFVIRVASMEEAVRSLRAAGVEVEDPSQLDEDMFTAWLTDPDGNRIELVQWPAGHPEGMTGADFEE